MTDNLPEAFARRMQQQLGGEYPAFLHALSAPPVRGIRVHPMKAAGLIPEDAEEAVPWTKNAYYLRNESKAGSAALHEAGAFYIQEPAAMFPAELLEAGPGEKILDLCAAPGGKSTQLGCAMLGRGLLVCNDPVYQRAQILSRNIERFGLPHTLVTCADPDQLAARFPEYFDAVLADVPCSGEGMFRREPLTKFEWTPEKASGCADRQRSILDSAAQMVRPGGRLVYSTCTYNPEENENNVEWFLKNHPDFEAVSFSLPGIRGTDGFFTCYPHRMKGEGQFAAKFRRKGNGSKFKASSGSLRRPETAMTAAMKRIFPLFPEADYLFGKTLVSFSGCPDVDGIRVLRAGLHLGECRGNIFIPDHAAAMSITDPGTQTLELTPDDVKRYIAGETICSDQDGWILLRYQGISIGWGKGSGGIIRNHYPKGLRKLHIIP